MSPRTQEQFEEVREKSRENILNAALKLFSQKGYFNTSVRQIAKEAGVSPGLLYNYFSSKEELVYAILKQAFDILDETLVSERTISPEERLRGSIEQFIDILRNKEGRIRMLAQMGLHQEKFTSINKVTQMKYLESVSKIESALSDMGVPESHLEARCIVAMLDGIMFEKLLMGDIVPMDEMKELLVRKYCRNQN